jgi:hypothetical protein
MYPKLKINVYFLFLNIGDLTFGITFVFTYEVRGKGKVIPVQAVEALRFARG